MITNITLENFKCFRHVSINPKLLTVLIGPNGTGKSSILQALLLLKYHEVGVDGFGQERQSKLISNYINESPNFIRGPSGFQIEIRVNNSTVPSSVRTFTLETLAYVPAARGLVRGTYDLGEDLPEHIPTQLGLDFQEEQLATNLAYNIDSQERLSNMLVRVAGTGMRALPIPPRQVVVRSIVSDDWVNIAAEGFGANTLIHLFYQLIASRRGSTVLIEEPEIHLHPKAQADLAEVLAETAKAEDKQIIMTTHSEHLVERLLLLVAEGTLSADDLAIYSFSKDEKGECFASEIEVTENGQVEGGLTDFYANNLDTLDRRVKALKQSK